MNQTTRGEGRTITRITLFVMALCFAVLAALMTRQAWKPIIDIMLE